MAGLRSGGAGEAKDDRASSNLVMVEADLKNKSKKGSEGMPAETEVNMTELMQRLKLTSEEAEAVILDDEDEGNLFSLDWALIGKVLSPNVLHIQTIMSALRPAWGNPKGLMPKSVADNTFIVEFESKADKQRVKEGAPWTVGKHAVLLNDFDPSLKPSEVSFDRIMLWARIMNPRFELMNRTWGEFLGAKIGRVEKVDVDGQGRAWGDYLRVRVSVDVSKPLMRFVTAYSKKHKSFERYDVKFERLPHYCFSCGIIGHSSLECPTPGERDEEGKLPYNADRLCVKEEKKRFASASRSGQSSQSSGKSSHFDDKVVDSFCPPKFSSGEKRNERLEIQQEVILPKQQKDQNLKLKGKVGVGNISMELLPVQAQGTKVAGQKRKQVKIYVPKGHVQAASEKMAQDVTNLALTLGGKCASNNSPLPLLPINRDDVQVDSHKKQKMEQFVHPTGSADQAEAAVEQPRHTP